MDVLTTKEAAAKLGISQRQIQTLIQRGRLPARKLGRDYVINEEDLKLIEDRKPGRPPQKAKSETSEVGKKRGRKT